MSWDRIMFAVAVPSGAQASVMNKVVCLTSALDAELELFNCVFDVDIARPGRFGSRGVEADIREIVAQRHRQIEKTAERLRTQGIRARSSVRWDYPAYEGIVRQVLRHKPDLLVVESRRKGAAARLLLTQSDFKLIETCPCPLLLIKTSRPYSAASTIAAVDPVHAHKKPAALDDAILDSATVVTQALSGKLLLFHARTPWEDMVRTTPSLRHIVEAEQPDAQSAYRESIDRRVRELARRHGVLKERTRVTDADVAESLPQLVRAESAGIVVMGAVSRSFVKRAVVGHTAERLLDVLDCDVLIVKPPGFRSPVRVRSAHHVRRGAIEPGRYIL
jgi:universal stress protein E